MGKFKKGNVEQGGKLAKPKINKGPLNAQKKGGVQNRVNKINPKKHSVKLPENIKEQIKNEKNKKNILEKANINQVVAVKGPIHNTQKAKLPQASVQNGKDKGNKKQSKNVNPQIKPTNNVPVSKPQNKRKAGPENNLEQQLGPTPKLPVPPSLKNKEKLSGPKNIQKQPSPKNNEKQSGPKNIQKQPGPKNLQKQPGPNNIQKQPIPKNIQKQPGPKNKQKQIPVSQKGPVINPKLATKEKPKTKLKKQEQKIVDSQEEGKVEDEDQYLEAAFDEAKFNEILKETTIAKVVGALKEYVASEVKKKKNEIFADFRYILNVTCFKIPYCPTRMVKLRVKHPVITDEDDVCLIVKDLQRGMKVDYEPTVHHYEDLLKNAGVKGIKAIMPFNQLRKEYGSFEMKTKLANTYDHILCDGSIVGHVVGFLGKIFRNTRCTPHAVRFTTNDISREIEKGLRKTCYKQGAKGSMISIPVAHFKMSTKNIVENILEVISQLKKVYPGGLPNIRNIFIRTNMKGTSSLPLYVSLVVPKKTPFVVGPKEENMKKLKETANKILEHFDVTLAGEILRKRQIETNDESDEEPQMKKKKEKKSGKTIEKAVKEKLLEEVMINSQNDGSEEDDDEGGSIDDDEEGSDEDGSGEEESDEQGSEEEEDEERNMAEGSDEEEDEEQNMAEGSDEEEDEERNMAEGSDEEESGDEEIDELESDSADDSTGDIEAESDENDDDTEESDEDDDGTEENDEDDDDE